MVFPYDYVYHLAKARYEKFTIKAIFVSKLEDVDFIHPDYDPTGEFVDYDNDTEFYAGVITTLASASWTGVYNGDFGGMADSSTPNQFPVSTPVVGRWVGVMNSFSGDASTFAGYKVKKLT